jgi:hypothetical protein
MGNTLLAKVRDFMSVNVQGLLEKELNACRLSHAIQLEGRHSAIVFLTVMRKWDGFLLIQPLFWL